MAKARAIVKRRKAVRNIRKITKTMQMIATAKFQKSLKRALASKPYTQKVRELVGELAATIGDVDHPLLRTPTAKDASNKAAVVVVTSNRGLAGAYNGSILRTAGHFVKKLESEGNAIELYVAGKKGVAFFNFARRPIVQRFDQFADVPKYEDVSRVGDMLIDRFVKREIDALYVVYMNFISAGQQKPETRQLLPLAALQAAPAQPAQTTGIKAIYDFYPDAKTLLDELLPLTVKSALYQAFLDAVTSENVARMIAMKSATDNADKMVKSLTMQYNRARQSQITTELAEIMGGVEAMG
jgi:F-type H+-transporting ATPase subunit gamma